MGQGLGQDIAKLFKKYFKYEVHSFFFFLTHSEYQLDWWLQ